MKYLKLFESQNPSRISDYKFQIFSSILKITDDYKITGGNFFYISDIKEVKDTIGWHLEDYEKEIIISFYNPNFEIEGYKIIDIYLRFEIDDDRPALYQFYGQYKKNVYIDVLFSENSFTKLKEFIKEDSPEIYYLVKNLSFDRIKDMSYVMYRRLS